MSVKDKRNEAIFISGLPEDYAAVVEKLRGGDSSNGGRLRLAKGETASSVLAVSAALVRKKKPEKSFDPLTLKVGQAVDGEGVYIGVYKIKGNRGLSSTFDVYAAPEDLTDENDERFVASYHAVVRGLNNKEDWHGYDGECFENSQELDEALVNGTYRGGWFIPPIRVLKGNIYKNKHKGELKGAFGSAGFNSVNCYWSCTEDGGNDRSKVFTLDCDDGEFDCDKKGETFLATRPVRAELRLE